MIGGSTAVANASHGHVETLPESYDITAWIFGMAQTQWLRSSGSYAECFNLRHGKDQLLRNMESSNDFDQFVHAALMVSLFCRSQFTTAVNHHGM